MINPRYSVRLPFNKLKLRSSCVAFSSYVFPFNRGRVGPSRLVEAPGGPFWVALAHATRMVSTSLSITIQGITGESFFLCGKERNGAYGKEAPRQVFPAGLELLPRRD
jgi:hypothetical protein